MDRLFLMTGISRSSPTGDQTATGAGWMKGVRPLLMFSYLIDYTRGGIEPHDYHVTNVLLHYCTAVLIALIVFRLLDSLKIELRATLHALRFHRWTFSYYIRCKPNRSHM